MKQWAELRGVPVRAFTLSEYLPGRDFWPSLWHRGMLILCSTFKRTRVLEAGSKRAGSRRSALPRPSGSPGVEICRAGACPASGAFRSISRTRAGGLHHRNRAGRFRRHDRVRSVQAQYAAHYVGCLGSQGMREPMTPSRSTTWRDLTRFRRLPLPEHRGLALRGRGLSFGSRGVHPGEAPAGTEPSPQHPSRIRRSGSHRGEPGELT
jgi:hypothetical protein